MKINIPLFNDPNISKYADFFEFMDIPGLSEENNNSYLIKLFPYFIHNIKFCFFIFSADEYHSKNSIKVFNDVISCFDESEKNEIFKNSIFILNKFDLPEDKILTENNFEKYLKETLNLPQVYYISCSSDQLILDYFKYQNYLNYMESIFNEMNKDELEPAEYVIEKLKKDFDIDHIEEYLDDDDENITNKAQIDEYEKYKGKFENGNKRILSISDYFYYKSYFKGNIKKSTSNKFENKIKEKIWNSFENILNIYINFDDYKDLLKKILEDLGIESEKIDDLKIILKQPKINSLKKSYLDIFKSFMEISDKLKKLKDHKYFDKMNDDIKIFEKTIKKEMKIRIPILGCYSCGKSSLLNNLIGIDILPKNTEVSTEVGLVLNYTDSINNICLKQINLKKSENQYIDYYYFSDSSVIYTKLDHMKEIISVINAAYVYEDKIVNILISFIKKLDKLNILLKSEINEIQIIYNILKKKENDLEQFWKWFNILDPKYKSDLNDIFSELEGYLNEIIESEKSGNKKKLLRKSEDGNDTFLKLIIPIEGFDKLNLTIEEKFQIELIDFPGLNSENNLLDKIIFYPFIKFSNGFIFVTKSTINEGDTYDIIDTIISKINTRKLRDFSFDSMLFVLTFWEKLPNLNLEEKKEDIKTAILSSDLSNSMFENQKNFLITKFSNKRYESFLNDSKICENINKLYSIIKQNINYEVNNIAHVKKLKKEIKNSLVDRITIKFEDDMPKDIKE